jgi:hypothetical protein
MVAEGLAGARPGRALLFLAPLVLITTPLEKQVVLGIRVLDLRRSTELGRHGDAVPKRRVEHLLRLWIPEPTSFFGGSPPFARAAVCVLGPAIMMNHREPRNTPRGWMGLMILGIVAGACGSSPDEGNGSGGNGAGGSSSCGAPAASLDNEELCRCIKVFVPRAWRAYGDCVPPIPPQDPEECVNVERFGCARETWVYLFELLRQTDRCLAGAPPCSQAEGGLPAWGQTSGVDPFCLAAVSQLEQPNDPNCDFESVNVPTPGGG